jgi:hypothetical protein
LTLVAGSIFRLRTLKNGGRSREMTSSAIVQKLWLRDESLEESDNLPDPDLLAQEIVEDLEAALEQFREIATDLGRNEPETQKN